MVKGIWNEVYHQWPVRLEISALQIIAVSVGLHQLSSWKKPKHLRKPSTMRQDKSANLDGHSCIVVNRTFFRFVSLLVSLLILSYGLTLKKRSKLLPKVVLTWSIRRWMINRPRPAGINFSNTSSKLLATCLKVLSMASSLRWSRTSTSSSIEVADLSSSSRRSRSWSRCFVKFVYCSNAFLFTCANFFKPSFTTWSFLTSFGRKINEV